MTDKIKGKLTLGGKPLVDTLFAAQVAQMRAAERSGNKKIVRPLPSRSVR
jgi:hypothetical protein